MEKILEKSGNFVRGKKWEPWPDIREHGENWKEKKEKIEIFKWIKFLLRVQSSTLSWPIERFVEAIKNRGICLEDDMKVMWVSKSKQTCWHCTTRDAVLESDTHSPQGKRVFTSNSTSGKEIASTSKFQSSHCLTFFEPFVGTDSNTLPLISAPALFKITAF